jgi:hypothetical protein
MGPPILLTPSCRRGAPRFFLLSNSSSVLRALKFFLLGLDLDALMLNIQTKARVDAHVLIGDPNQSKEADQVPAPIRQQEFVTGNQKEKESDIVTQAILTSKHVKELAPCGVAGACLLLAVVARLTKDFLVRDGPGDAGSRNRKHEKPDNLQGQGHQTSMRRCLVAFCGMAAISNPPTN